MKPHVICHMAVSADGRTLLSRWRPSGAGTPGLFERLHEELGGDAWLGGRATGQEFAKQTTYHAHTGKTFPRDAWIARRAERLRLERRRGGPIGSVQAMTLESSRVLEGGAVWLRYRLQNRITPED